MSEGIMKKKEIRILESQIQSKQFQSDDQQIKDMNPSFLTSRIKIKIIKKNGNITTKSGTCFMIAHNLALTVAHNVHIWRKTIKDYKNTNQIYQDKSYVRQGLGNGQFICDYKIVQYIIHPQYTQECNNSQTNDIALLILQPDTPQQKSDDNYMPIVVLSTKTIKKLTKIQMLGYDRQFNKKPLNQPDQSSLLVEPCHFEKNVKEILASKIIYSGPSGQGCSGAALIAQYQHPTAKAPMKIIFSMHKGSQDNQGKKESVAINAGRMLEFVNQFAYQKYKKPLIFTEKTFNLKDNEHTINQAQTLLLMNKKLQAQDILVLTAYDITKVQKISLTGNRLGQLGVIYLLRRKFPYLSSLYLHENHIDSLEKVSEQGWKNIQQITHLGLGINKLSDFPLRMRILKSLKKVWFSFNCFKTAPMYLSEFCQANVNQNFTIYLCSFNNDLDGNLIPKEERNKYKQTYMKYEKAQIIWASEEQLKKEELMQRRALIKKKKLQQFQKQQLLQTAPTAPISGSIVSNK